jgi:hypothetical protein
MVKKHVKVIFVKVQKNLTSISVTDDNQAYLRASYSEYKANVA